MGGKHLFIGPSLTLIFAHFRMAISDIRYSEMRHWGIRRKCYDLLLSSNRSILCFWPSQAAFTSENLSNKKLLNFDLQTYRLILSIVGFSKGALFPGAWGRKILIGVVFLSHVYFCVLLCTSMTLGQCWAYGHLGY